MNTKQLQANFNNNLKSLIDWNDFENEFEYCIDKFQEETNYFFKEEKVKGLAKRFLEKCDAWDYNDVQINFIETLCGSPESTLTEKLKN
ncbi:MAG: hypothetical protein ACTSQG_00005, partial [Promethearchaeota archaeon]